MEPKAKRYSIVLISSSGEDQSTIQMQYTKDAQGCVTDVCARMQYGGKEYIGKGTDDYGIDAIADLQQQLPEGILLKCCLACKHGNLCPVGNAQNEVFCIKDTVPKEPRDLWYYTEDPKERAQRSRGYFDRCHHFAPQSKGYYTYNDFIYYLTDRM